MGVSRSEVVGLMQDQAAQDAALADLEARAVAAFVLAGYGGLSLTTPVALPDITATAQILPADTAAVTTPKGVTQDVANNGLVINEQGIWQISAGVALTHADTNDGRLMLLQLYNVTDASLSRSSVIAVGRNQDGTNFSATILFETLPANIGDLFVIRLVSAADTFSAVTLENFNFSAVHLANAQNI